MLNLKSLLKILNDEFLAPYKTKIIGGFNEPYYLAARDKNKAEIQFSHDYISSALHELSHWCVAGEHRRKLNDYGYWYTEDGRNAAQQQAFFQVEVVPQTLEWAFSIVCGVKFVFSADNLTESVQGLEAFKIKVRHQMHSYLHQGFPPRVNQILFLLARQSEINNPLELIKNKYMAHNSMA